MKRYLLASLLLLLTACYPRHTQRVEVLTRMHSFFLEGERVAVIQPFLPDNGGKELHGMLAQIGSSLMRGTVVKAPYRRVSKGRELEKAAIYRLAREAGADYALIVRVVSSSQNITPEKSIYPDYTTGRKDNKFGRFAYIDTEIELLRLRDLKTADKRSFSHVFQTSPIYENEEASVWDKKALERGVSAAFTEYCIYLKGESRVSQREIFLN